MQQYGNGLLQAPCPVRKRNPPALHGRGISFIPYKEETDFLWTRHWTRLRREGSEGSKGSKGSKGGGIALLEPGKFSHFEPGENRQNQPNKNSHYIYLHPR
ncbi:hypothetical protein, partial [uncultured Dialister sp.]|uniref:hypothetical protein n=1 Tax=uncultured Dialister sp. TaxID=278064 RepID=UPI0025FBD783